jgi:hypothetical protein
MLTEAYQSSRRPFFAIIKGKDRINRKREKINTIRKIADISIIKNAKNRRRKAKN